MFEKTSPARPNVAFAGLTAAGKTTHAKILAQQLGYDYVSASEIFIEILGMQENPDKLWFTKYDEMEKAREGDAIDVELEARVTKRANKEGGLVIDTWTHSWIYDGPRPLIRIWLESDEASRVRKCFVSQGKRKALDIEGCQELVNKKDSETRAKFIRRLHYDLFTDRQRYNIIINNSALIPEATDSAAEQGIAAFAPVVLEVVEYCTQKLNDPTFDPSGAIAGKLVADSNDLIERINL